MPGILIETLAVIIALMLLFGMLYRRALDRIGFDPDEVEYADADGQGRLLYSAQYGLQGKPDYLLRGARHEIIPVEIKLGKCPPSGQPHDSHLMQLAAYCLLVEDVTGATVRQGRIRYRDAEIEIDYDDDLRDSVLELLEEMRLDKEGDAPHREHSSPRKCERCGYADICDESLA